MKRDQPKTATSSDKRPILTTRVVGERRAMKTRQEFSGCTAPATILLIELLVTMMPLFKMENKLLLPGFRAMQISVFKLGRGLTVYREDEVWFSSQVATGRLKTAASI
jgi:hypothetical protein